MLEIYTDMDWVMSLEQKDATLFAWNENNQTTKCRFESRS